jgi:peptide/nickel transport system ATP-binding protein
VITLSNIILTIGQLKKHFVTRQGIVKAVDGISFFVEEGETFGLVGESGSGKSTVAYTVVGMYRPTEGKIIYRRENISRESKNRSLTMKKEIQIVFQDPGTSLNPKRSIKQILEMPLKVHNISKNQKDRIDKIKELLEMVQLPVDYMYKYPSMIGGGEKQMVAIARALTTNPSFVLLDEPTSALDVSVQAKIINMLIQFQKKFKLSYLFITHDLSLKNPLHPYTQMLLSSIPVISDEEEALKPKKIMSTGEIPSPVDVPSGCSFHLRCPKKMDICFCEDPIMVEVSEGHTVRCHLYTK